MNRAGGGVRVARGGDLTLATLVQLQATGLSAATKIQNGRRHLPDRGQPRGQPKGNPSA